MKSYEVLRKAFKPVGCKKVAQELHVSLSLVHQWSRGQQGHSEAVNPLERTAQLVALTGDEALLEWLCAQRGGRFVRRRELPSLARRYEHLLLAELGQFFRSVA